MTSRPPLSDRVVQLLPALVDPTMESLLSEVRWYRHLPDDLLVEEVRQITALNLRLFGQLLREGRTPRVGDIEAILQLATRRAEDRIPLPVVMEAYYSGTLACWRRLADVAEPGEVGEIIELGHRVLEYLQFVCSRVTEAYVEARLALSGDERAARCGLVDDLVAGTATPDSWARAGLTPWELRTVIALRTVEGCVEDPILAGLRGRRRSRAVVGVLARLSDREVLSSGDVGGSVLVVLPGQHARPALHDALEQVLDVRWVAGVVEARDDPSTSAAIAAAVDLADVARRLDRPDGTYDMTDLRLELQFTRPGPARDHLVEMLVPLAEHPDLMTTLSAYLDQPGSRRSVATRLHVHRNTLDYRLSRIRDVLGIDPTTAEGALSLRAALVASRYVAACS